MFYWILFGFWVISIIGLIYGIIQGIINKSWKDIVLNVVYIVLISIIMLFNHFIEETWDIRQYINDDTEIFRDSDKKFEYDSITKALREQNYREKGFYD